MISTVQSLSSRVQWAGWIDDSDLIEAITYKVPSDWPASFDAVYRKTDALPHGAFRKSYSVKLPLGNGRESIYYSAWECNLP